MRKNKRVFRWTCVGVLCAGLLLVGVGAGVGLAEAATFTYAGDRVLPDAAEEVTRRHTIPLETEGRVKVTSYAGGLLSQLRETARIEISEEVDPGTIQMDLTYQTVGPEIGYWTDYQDGRYGDYRSPAVPSELDRSDAGLELGIFWDDRGDLAAVLACKDQLLSDLKERKIGNYTPAELTGAVITVNPADADRVTIG